MVAMGHFEGKRVETPFPLLRLQDFAYKISTIFDGYIPGHP